MFLLLLEKDSKEVEHVFKEKAAIVNAELIFASDSAQNLKSDLLGDYQLKNIQTAVAAIHNLKGFAVSAAQIEKGLLNVVKNTDLKGRWQILQEAPKVICDTAHNKEGLQISNASTQKRKIQEFAYCVRSCFRQKT